MTKVALNTYPLVVPLLEDFQDVRLISVYDVPFYGKSRKDKKKTKLIRVLDFIIFSVYSTYFVLIKNEYKTYILFTSPPMLFIIWSWFLRRRRLPYIIHCMDVYPEMLKAAYNIPNIVYSFLLKLARYSLSKAARIVLIGEDQLKLESIQKLSLNKIVFQENKTSIVLGELPRRNDDVVRIGYFGSYGVPHDIDCFCSAIKELDSIHLSIVSKTSKARELVSKYRGVVNIVHYDNASNEEFQMLLNSVDYYLVSLRSEFTGISVPSKIYTALCNGVKVIFYGNASSDIAMKVSQNHGLSIHSGLDKKTLVRILKDLEPASERNTRYRVRVNKYLYSLS